MGGLNSYFLSSCSSRLRSGNTDRLLQRHRMKTLKDWLQLKRTFWKPWALGLVSEQTGD